MAARPGNSEKVEEYGRIREIRKIRENTGDKEDRKEYGEAPSNVDRAALLHCTDV